MFFCTHDLGMFHEERIVIFFSIVLELFPRHVGVTSEAHDEFDHVYCPLNQVFRFRWMKKLQLTSRDHGFQTGFDDAEGDEHGEDIEANEGGGLDHHHNGGGEGVVPTASETGDDAADKHERHR